MVAMFRVARHINISADEESGDTSIYINILSVDKQDFDYYLHRGLTKYGLYLEDEISAQLL